MLSPTQIAVGRLAPRDSALWVPSERRLVDEDALGVIDVPREAPSEILIFPRESAAKDQIEAAQPPYQFPLGAEQPRMATHPLMPGVGWMLTRSAARRLHPHQLLDPMRSELGVAMVTPEVRLLLEQPEARFDHIRRSDLIVVKSQNMTTRRAPDPDV